jgi:hypothetical protein
VKRFSLAVRIESQLLRRMRLELFPEADAGTEADLWFSAFVDKRAASGIVFHASYSALLRDRLAVKRAVLERAWNVVKELHRNISPVLFAEERLAYFALTGKEEEMRDVLRSAIATMLAPGRESLAVWAMTAFKRLPRQARQSEEGQMLAFGASLRLNSIRAEDVPKPVPEWAAWLAPGPIEMVTFGVALLEDAVEFGPPGRSGSHRIELPKTSPVWVQLSWEDTRGRQWETVELPLNKLTLVETGPGVTEVSIRTLLSDQYWLTTA